MKKVGIYPGTFDPITYGHIDVIKRALRIVEILVVAVTDDNSKDYLFSSEERVSLIKNSLFKDLKFKKGRIKIISFNMLTTSLCLKNKANIIFRWAKLSHLGKSTAHESSFNSINLIPVHFDIIVLISLVLIIF